MLSYWLKRKLGKRNESSDFPELVGIYMTPVAVSMAYARQVESGEILIEALEFFLSSELSERREALKAFVEKHQLAGKPASYVLPVKEYIFNLIEEPTPKEGEPIKAALAEPIKDIIDYPIEESIYDFFELPFPRAQDGTKMAYVSVMNGKNTAIIEETVTQAGLRLHYIDIPEMCLRNIATRHAEEERGVLVIKLHPKGGQVILSKGGRLLIARRVEVPLESLLIDEEEESPPINLPDGSEDVVDQLVLDIQRSLDYFSSLFRQSPVGSILIYPSNLNRHCLKEYLQHALGMEVFFLDLNDIGQGQESLSSHQQANFLIPLGATLRVMERELDAAD